MGDLLRKRRDLVRFNPGFEIASLDAHPPAELDGANLASLDRASDRQVLEPD
jgi:hypothetical protein